jgi:hypothetical protein
MINVFQAKAILKKHGEALGNGDLREAVEMAADALNNVIDREDAISELRSFANDKGLRLFVNVEHLDNVFGRDLSFYFNGDRLVNPCKEYALDLVKCGMEGIEAIKKDVEGRLLVR